MILMSIDASTKATGVAIFTDKQLIYHKCITANDSNVYKRIDEITGMLTDLALEYHVDTVVLEDVVPDDTHNNQQIFRMLMHLQGVIALKLNRVGLKINQYFVASNWRKTVGIKTGRGVYRETLKKNSMKLVKDHYNIDVNDDESDAICIGIAYFKQQDEEFNWE